MAAITHGICTLEEQGQRTQREKNKTQGRITASQQDVVSHTSYNPGSSGLGPELNPGQAVLSPWESRAHLNSSMVVGA